MKRTEPATPLHRAHRPPARPRPARPPVPGGRSGLSPAMTVAAPCVPLQYVTGRPGFRASVNAAELPMPAPPCAARPGPPAPSGRRGAGLAEPERGDTTRYAAQDAVYRMERFVPLWSHHGVTRGWRPVTRDPYRRAVLAASALFRRQSPRNPRTGCRVCAASHGRDGRRVWWSKSPPSSRLWRRMVPTDTESAARDSGACAVAGRRCDGSQVDR